MLSITKKKIIRIAMFIVTIIILIITYKIIIGSNSIQWYVDNSGSTEIVDNNTVPLTCSKPCGGGIRTRSVTCDAGIDKCDNNNIPINEETCNEEVCGMLNYSEFGNCVYTQGVCGEGVKSRTVECIAGVCHENNDDLDLIRSCDTITCGEWEEKPWSVCPNCKVNEDDDPQQTRDTATCSIDGLCPVPYTGKLSQSCNLDVCAPWSVGLWSSEDDTNISPSIELFPILNKDNWTMVLTKENGIDITNTPKFNVTETVEGYTKLESEFRIIPYNNFSPYWCTMIIKPTNEIGRVTVDVTVHLIETDDDLNIDDDQTIVTTTFTNVLGTLNSLQSDQNFTLSGGYIPFTLGENVVSSKWTWSFTRG